MSDAPRVDCDVCRDPSMLEHANAAWELCDEHSAAMANRVAESVLREVIPGAFHHARPSHLPAPLAGWSARPGTGLYLYGPVGSGKSHAAAAIVKREWMRMYRAGAFPKAAWMNVPSAIVASLTAFSRRTDVAQIWDASQSASILVMDDIGIETPKDWVRMRLYALIEHRLHAALPTIVTSNLALDDLADRLDSPQIASRLSQMCTQVEFTGKDRRPGLAPPLEEGPTE